MRASDLLKDVSSCDEAKYDFTKVHALKKGLRNKKQKGRPVNIEESAPRKRKLDSTADGESPSTAHTSVSFNLLKINTQEFNIGRYHSIWQSEEIILYFKMPE